jgi:four helix bundle protein
METSHKTLAAYQKARELSRLIFRLTKNFPDEEKYSLTDQIRKSSRSILVNVGETYRQRNYPKHYSSKLTIADGEATETLIWLDVAVDCEYATEEEILPLQQLATETGKLVGYMLRNPTKFGVNS